MTLGISVLKNVFLLHTKMHTHDIVVRILDNIFLVHTKAQHYYLKYPIVVH